MDLQIPTSETGHRWPGRKALIAEDERLIAENLKLTLEEIGFNVTDIVSSGEEAFKQARSNPPDLMLMDIRIHGNLDGVSAAKLIQDYFGKGIPVIFLTAHSQGWFSHIKKLNPETFIYLNKPYSQEDLLRGIEVLMNRAEHSA